MSLPSCDRWGIQKSRARIQACAAFAVLGDYKLLNQISQEIPVILLAWCAGSGCLINTRNHHRRSVAVSGFPRPSPIELSFKISCRVGGRAGVCLPLVLAVVFGPVRSCFFATRKNNAERAGVRGVPGRMSRIVRRAAPNGLAAIGTTCASMCVTRAILLFVFLIIISLQY
jgi:hypothetical protein